MCRECVYDDLSNTLSDLRDEISTLDAKAASLSREELVSEIERIAEEMWK